jgi:hypothetical protein
MSVLIVRRMGENMTTIRLDRSLGHVRGKITDVYGEGIMGCRVWLRETGQSSYTDFEGHFLLPNINPGLYSIIVDCEGYTTSVIPDITVDIGENSGYCFALQSPWNFTRRRRTKISAKVMVYA